jgi:thiol-disulfide isomerase/thioredoxin
MGKKGEKRRPEILKWIERLLLVGVLAFIGYRLGPQIGALLGIGGDERQSPSFSFTTLDGTAIDSNELRGKVVVLNFWATWCGPCRLEMPSLQSLHEDRGGEGVVVLGVSTDSGSRVVIDDFLAERGITYPVGRATSRMTADFGGIPMIPTTFLIDKEGAIRHEITGYAAPPVLRVAVGRLVAE